MPIADGAGMATHTTARIITAAVLAVTLGSPAHTSSDTAELVTPTLSTARPISAVELPAPVFATDQDGAAYAWAQDLFTSAGFTEPAAVVEFFIDADPCGGARGRAWLDASATPTIAVCATHANPSVQQAWRERTLLHELAHAWIDANVGDASLEAFTELRGLETWSSRDVNWEERATEHAAEIFMWGIQDGEYDVDFRIDGTGCTELAAGYELLTGISVACDTPAA